MKVLLLGGLARMQMETEKPFVSSAIYTAVACMFLVVFKAPPLVIVSRTLIVLAASSLYFCVLNLLDEGSGAWWATLITGFLAFPHLG